MIGHSCVAAEIRRLSKRSKSGTTSSMVKSPCMKRKANSTPSPAASLLPPGPATPPLPSVQSKADRLFDMTFPYGPEFPLDGDTVADLSDHPGELPTSAKHFCALLSDAPRRQK
jgi:hypothetical protein